MAWITTKWHDRICHIAYACFVICSLISMRGVLAILYPPATDAEAAALGFGIILPLMMLLIYLVPIISILSFLVWREYPLLILSVLTWVNFLLPFILTETQPPTPELDQFIATHLAVYSAVVILTAMRWFAFGRWKKRNGQGV